MSAVKADDASTLLFFSAGPAPEPGGGWHHDVQVAHWRDGQWEPPAPFISREEAQEPVSVAQLRSGNILVTFEDGWQADGSVTQRYGVYRNTLAPVAPYPREVKRGGHSGHAAAVGEQFVVVYSDEWIHGGGVDDLGSGFGVYAKVYDAQGEPLHALALALADARREWWPVVAGGSQTALAVWQRFIPGSRQAELVAAPIEPQAGTAGKPTRLHAAVNYYTYQTAWLPAIERFLVVGTSGRRGFAHLLDSDGRVTASLACMPATVREAGVAVSPASDGDTASVAFTPAAEGGLLALQASPDRLQAVGLLQDGQTETWPTNGNLGLFTTQGQIDWFFFAGSTLASRRFDPGAPRPPAECPDP